MEWSELLTATDAQGTRRRFPDLCSAGDPCAAGRCERSIITRTRAVGSAKQITVTFALPFINERVAERAAAGADE